MPPKGQKESRSLRTILLNLRKKKGFQAEIDEAPPCPEEYYHIYHIFSRISCNRQSGMRLNPLSFSDIKSYFDLSGDKITKEELDLLMDADRITIAEYNRE